MPAGLIVGGAVGGISGYGYLGRRDSFRVFDRSAHTLCVAVRDPTSAVAGVVL